MKITNFKNLAKNPLRKKALLIAEAGYEAIDIQKVIEKEIRLNKKTLNIKDQKFDLDSFGKVYLIGIGKGSALACASLAKILGKKLTNGIALDIKKLITQNSKLKTFVGTHPLPSKQNIKATQKIIKLAKNLKKDDLLITFIAGGGSALACASEAELNASRTIFKELTKGGADIIELNTVRKHLSEIKGGNLVKLAYPATVISLIISDIVGNNLSMVASGPTVYDKTAKKDAAKIIQKYLPKSKLIRALIETPKDKKIFRKVKNILFLSNREPVLAMLKKAQKLGFKAKIYSLRLHGEAKRALIPMIKKIKRGEVLLAGGETTVKLQTKNSGKGGRNMEAVLGAISNFHFRQKRIPGGSIPISKNLLVLSIASDGRDNTEAAGAIADHLTIERAKKLKLEPRKFLGQNNSFNFFKKTCDLIFAKQKSFNVSDLMLVLSPSKD